MKALQSARGAGVVIATILAATSVQAEIDGHRPDAWRVIDVSTKDALNARMGPGTNYPVVETFSHDERGMQQTTCVPFILAAHYMAMSQAQIDALPPRWCLMRSADMSKAGWVAQRFIRSDDAIASSSGEGMHPESPDKGEAPSAAAMINEAEAIVRDLYAGRRAHLP